MSDHGSLLPTLYEMDQTNGWSIGMRAITHSILAQMALPPGPLLEVGCGSGLFNQQLSQHYPKRSLFGADLHPLALAYANTHAAQPPKLMRADLLHLPFSAASVSAVIALDTFDQQGVDLFAALAESWRVLQPQGLLLLRVSAYAWLQGGHDTAFNTGRRFAKDELAHALQASRFTVERLTFANTLLAPPIIALRLLQRLGWLPSSEGMVMDSSANEIFARALGYETHWLAQRDLPFGISLYAVAQKHG